MVKILWKLLFYFHSPNIIRLLLCTCEDSWAVVACAKLWYDQIIIFVQLLHLFNKIWIMSSEACAKWVPSCSILFGPQSENSTTLESLDGIFLDRQKNMYFFNLRFKIPRVFHKKGNIIIELSLLFTQSLTHWGRVTQKCVSKLTIIGFNNGLPPDRRQAIIGTNVGILLIGTLRTNFSEILSEIHTFSFKKMRLKGSSEKWRSFCLGLNVLISPSSLSVLGRWTVENADNYGMPFSWNQQQVRNR